MVLEGIKASPPPTFVIVPGRSLALNSPLTLDFSGTVPQGEEEPKTLLGRVGPGGEALALIIYSHS